jgi:hypothetical protein
MTLERMARMGGVKWGRRLAGGPTSHILPQFFMQLVCNRASIFLKFYEIVWKYFKPVEYKLNSFKMVVST